ncbi:MFS-type transporter [Penicillium ucsense]|uniref:MFS-type transporter n=1 Tax=Penicillium ucsense TaxID=2839758 RepID=A0A8J8W526_9EURO|nr:MFS-type transporter [Penicillium ucsense]KAF7735163.1 MFS-type transporter [Penicillium ucsense]
MESVSQESKCASVHEEKVMSDNMRDDVDHHRPLPDGYHPRTEEEKALSRSVNRKMDLFLLPFLSILYLFNGLDRGNVGNAQTQGFSKDIGVTPNDVNDSVSLFFVTFVIFQPISAAVGRLVGAKFWIPTLMFLWGGLTVANAFVHGRGQLIAVRLLIGLCEAGFYPTALFYLSTFYTRYDLGVRIGLFFGQYAIAGAFSGAIAYGIFHMHGSLHNWQYLFVIEGALTMGFALVSCAFLPSDPSSAWFLSKSERDFACERIRTDSESYTPSDLETNTSNKKTSQLTRSDIVETMRDWKLWTALVCNICASVPSQAFSVFLPLVVKGLGYTSIQANLMSVPPFVCGAVGLYLFTFSSDRYKERGLHIVGGLIVCLIGLVMTITIENNHGRYIALCVLLIGSYATSPLTMAWLSGNTPEPGKRSLVLGVNGFGNLAGVIGSQIFRSKYAPRYLVPFYATLGFISFALVGYIAYRIMLKRVNVYRARKIATWTLADIQAERMDNKRLGDKKYTFVYGL